jgi:hypothetical protein
MIFPGHKKDLNPGLVAKLKPYRKTAPANAVQIHVEFRVDSLEGDYAQGKPGDYLMCGPAGELYICDQEIFKDTYEEIEKKVV